MWEWCAKIKNRGEEKMSTRTVYCQNCGEMIPEDAAFCPYCGTPNDAAGTQQPDPNPEPEFTVPDPIPENGFLPSDGPKEPKKNWILILAVVIIMLAAAAVGIFLIAPAVMKAASSKTAAADVSVETSTPALTETPVPTAEPTAVPTAVPTATPTAAPTPTPTAVPTVTPTPVPTLTPAAITEAPAQSEASSFVADTTTSYFWPDSNTRYYSESDLNGLTALQLRYITNEIFAREGYIFKKQEWYDYFSQKTWYHPTIPADQFTDDMLNPYEKANVDMISAYEKARGWNQDI
jgi:hypothetical protein